LSAGLSFAWHFTRGLVIKPQEENSETVLQRYYGKVLYDIFFKSYVIRVWGISPAEFSPAFARERIPRFSLLGALSKMTSATKNRFARRVSTDSFVEKFEGNLYTTNKGFSLITERMGEKVRQFGGEIVLNARVIKLLCEADQYRTVE